MGGRGSCSEAGGFQPSRMGPDGPGRVTQDSRSWYTGQPRGEEGAEYVNRGLKNSHGGRYAGYDRLNDVDDDLVFRAKPPTIEFSKFNGQEDAGLWLYAADRWFKNHPTREERKAHLASFYLEGDALHWWEWLERSYAATRTLITLPMFQEELCYQFGKSEGWGPEQLAKLRQTRTVAEYRSEFLKLGNQCKGVPEETRVGLCVAGLKPEIATAVRVFESDLVRTAFRYAGHREEELASWRSVIARYQRSSEGGNSSATGSGGGSATAGAGTGAVGGNPPPTAATGPRPGPRPPPKGFVRLTPAEMEQKHREGKCFNCNERFTFAHQCARPDVTL
ncbi:unnamed protein product [Linum trigynum]|uniref:Retrotransposon gag domain-containing protein n=1 Tax=Linum trigynum TaxID=586398 RepID=A0AAV2CAM9_9ROSI